MTMFHTMAPASKMLFAGLAMAATAALAPLAHAAGDGHGVTIERQSWSFGGFFGQFDSQQLQRGFNVYSQVCASCHGLKRLSWRNLKEVGGPRFPEEDVKAFAAAWPNKIPEMNDAGEIVDKKGNILARTPKLSDPILGPFANEAAARTANNGALPPDLSVVVKARNVEYTGTVWGHPGYMLRDILTGYQEGGADYLYALLTGYTNAPEGFKLADGMYYNTAFPGHQIAMVAPPLGKDSPAEYADKSMQTPEQQAKDVTAFLAWAADPSLDQRKRIGWQVMLYLLITTILLYLGKKRIWAKMH